MDPLTAFWIVVVICIFVYLDVNGSSDD